MIWHAVVSLGDPKPRTSTQYGQSLCFDGPLVPRPAVANLGVPRGEEHV